MPETPTFETNINFTDAVDGERVTSLIFEVPTPNDAESPFVIELTPRFGTIQVSSPDENVTVSTTASTNGSVTVSLAPSHTTGQVRVGIGSSSEQNLVFFQITQTTAQADGGTSQATVFPEGSFQITSLAAGASYRGLYYFVTAIPENGRMSFLSPRFLVPAVTEETDFSFDVLGDGATASSLESSSAGIQIDGSTVTVTSQLSQGTDAIVMGDFASESSSGSFVFTVQRLSSSSVASGSQMELLVRSNGRIAVSSLASSCMVQGSGASYQTTAEGDYILHFTAEGIDFSSSPATFEPTQSWIQQLPLSQDMSSLQIAIENQEADTFQSAHMTLITGDGSLDDPTIVNNPDKDGN
jgi:hypothetical protein